MKTLARLGVVVAFALAATACRVTQDSPLPYAFGECPVPIAGTPDAGVPPSPTYWTDAKPIFDAKCHGCHQPGGVGPFVLETYMDALVSGPAMRSAIAADLMPPWQPEPCCNEYRWDRSLTPSQKATLLAWFDQGMQEGDESDEPPPLATDDGGLARVDVRVEMPEPFTPMPIIGGDEIRCFLLDWPIADETYVVGLNVVPGNRALVHHVIVFTIDADDADGLADVDAEDDRPGWDCYGDAGSGEIMPTGGIGGWAPGYRGVQYPDGIGKKVPANTRLVMQVHYNAYGSRGSDRTAVEVQLADSVTKELKGTGVLNPLWLVGDGMPIAKDDPDASVWYAYDPTTVTTGGKAVRVYSVMHHMHSLGTIGRVAILHPNGTTECLLNITRWDFHWLGEYWLAKPTILSPGDRLYVECHWDNTAENQRIIDGEQDPPRALHWGTDQEMCAAAINFTEL